MHVTIENTHCCIGLSADREIDWGRRQRVSEEEEARALLHPCEQTPELMHKLHELLQELDPGIADELAPADVVRELAHRVGFGGLAMWIEPLPFEGETVQAVPENGDYIPLVKLDDGNL